MLGPTLFNSFTDVLDDGFESIFTRFADSTKLGGEVNMSDGKAVLKRNLDRLEACDSKNSVKFNIDKHIVLTGDDITKEPSTGWRSQRVWGAALLNGTRGILVDNKLNISQQ